MKASKLILFIILSLVIAIPAFAKKYSDAPAGQGTSTVGTGGDYASLKDASVDFCTTANTGSWTIEVLNNLSESMNPCFGNTVAAGATITLKPASGVSPTITFTQTVDDPGTTPTGSLKIGSNSTTALSAIKTDRFVIDGSNNGTNSRDMTITNSAVTFGARLINVVGNSDGVTIKNVNIINKATGTSPAGIVFRTQFPSSGVSAVPTNGTLQNCYIICTTGTTPYGIQYTSGGTKVAGTLAMTGMSAIGNYIESKHSGIMANGSLAGGTFSNNTIRIRQTAVTAVLGSAFYLMYAGDNGVGGKELIFNNNLCDRLICHTATTTGSSAGIYGFGAEGSGVGTNIKVYNNIFSGFQLGGTGSAVGGFLYRGIAISHTSATVFIYHNSINMPDAPLYPNAGSNSGAITMFTGISAAYVKNNIIRQEKDNSHAFYYSSTLPIESNNNVVYAASNASTGRYGSTSYLSLADWQTGSSKDALSQSVDPTTTTPSAWASATDLHFSPAAGWAYPMQGVPQISGITTDIDGDARAATCWPGADEHSGVEVNVPVELSGFDTE